MGLVLSVFREKFCIASLLISLVLLTGCSNPNQADINALKALYESTGGENWRNNNNWNSDQPLDAWYGIKTNAEGAVTEINLERNHLKGPLPKKVSGLKQLKVLNLASNPLNSPLPSSWLQSRNMEKLMLFNSRLTGSLPLEITEMNKLRMLYLYGNHFSGTIPEALYELTELRELRLNSNKLSGSISPNVSMLKKLRVFYVDNNRLSGSIPDEISQIPYLKYFDISYNQFTGVIPATMVKLEYLEQLRAKSNQLTGPIPLGFLSNDELYIDIRKNPAISSVPIEFHGQENVSISFDKPEQYNENDLIKQWFKAKRQEQIEKYGMSIDMTPDLDFTR